MAVSLGAQSLPLATDPDGVVRVGRTRVTLDTVVSAFGEGVTAEEIVQQYPTLHLADVYAVLGYYLRHQDEVDAYMRLRQDQAERIRAENEACFSSAGIRERLLARRVSQQP